MAMYALEWARGLVFNSPPVTDYGEQRIKMAQATAKVTGATTLMIDELYGWRQAERAKVQQLTYAGLKARAP